MATIKDVARLAGVSIGTVDRIIHNRGRFASGTARRVKQAIQDLDYTPDIRARNLSLSRKCRIAVLMPSGEQDSGYWQLPLGGMKRALAELASSHVRADFFHFDRYNAETYRTAFARMSESEYDGYIVAPLLAAETEKMFEDIYQSKPVVFFDTDIKSAPRYSFIGQNSKDAGRLAAKLINLMTRGCKKRIIAVTPDAENEHLLYRLDGFTEKAKLPVTIFRLPAEGKALNNRIEELKGLIREEVCAVYVTDSSAHIIAGIVESEGLSGKVNLLGFDMVPDNVSYLQKGVIDFILTQRPVDQGVRSIQTLYKKVIIGTDSEDEQFLPIDIITRENMKTFADGHF